MLRQLLIFLHLLSAMAWIGGMFFAYFCLRPAATEVLEPPKRLPLWVATFSRFLPYMSIAVAIILASGISLLMATGMHLAPIGWHIMLTLGLIMAAVFGYVYLTLYPKLRAQCAASSWPEAAKTLNKIRQLVAVNLVLGTCVVAAAISAR